MPQNKRVIPVTGGTGFIASKPALHLLEQNSDLEVVPFGRNPDLNRSTGVKNSVTRVSDRYLPSSSLKKDADRIKALELFES